MNIHSFQLNINMSDNTLNSIGVIMDGNRRWAKEQGLPTIKGHKAGADKLKEVVRWSKEIGIKHITAYAFSTENWNRTEEEVSYLMGLMKHFFTTEIKELEKEGAHIRFIGDRERFASDIQEILNNVEERTKDNKVIEIVIALSYGGRSEILHAVQSMMSEEVIEITEEEFSKHLWTRGTPDPELIIRTGGKIRTSNFLPWQSVYSEWYFTDTKWPGLTREEFLSAISGFGAIQRNFGT